MDLQSAFPFWWLHTQFGLLVFMLIFLTWGLLIINLFLVMILYIHRIFGRRKTEDHVSLSEIENIGKDVEVKVTPKRTRRKKAPPVE